MESSSENILQLWQDPISLEIMHDAVIVPCGHSFSEKSIREWLQSHTTCPLCKKTLHASDISPNYVLRDTISRYMNKLEGGDHKGLQIKKPVDQWTVGEVTEWLLCFPELVPSTATQIDEEIDGTRLSVLTVKEVQFLLCGEDEENAYALHGYIRNIVDKSKKLSQTRSQERTPLLTPDLERRGRSISLPSEDRFGVIQRESSGVVDYHDDPGSASCCYKCFCCCCLWKYWIAGARASPRGCCCCRCTNCFVCGEAEDLVEMCPYNHSPTCGFIDCCCGEQHSTYFRRTLGAVCLPLFFLILILLVILEITFWIVVGILVVLLGVFILFFLYVMSGK